MPQRHIAVAIAAICTVAIPIAAHASCPDARDLRRAGEPVAAEAAARACMATDAQDVDAWIELSRAVGYQQRFDEALHWAERSLERYPADADVAAWRVRLLAWSGRLPAARAAYAELVARAPGVRDDPETAMLEVDLAFWGHDWRGATEGFTAYLARFPDDAEALRKRGLAWSERGEVDRAVADLERSCSLGGRASCAWGSRGSCGCGSRRAGTSFRTASARSSRAGAATASPSTGRSASGPARTSARGSRLGSSRRWSWPTTSSGRGCACGG